MKRIIATLNFNDGSKKILSSSLLHISFQSLDRPNLDDTTEYDIYSNTGELRFLSYKKIDVKSIKNIAISYQKDSNTKKIATFLLDESEYNDETKEYRFTLKDSFLSWQKKQIEIDSFEAKTLWDILWGCFPQPPLPYDEYTEFHLRSITISILNKISGSLWDVARKICEAGRVRIFEDSDGYPTIAREAHYYTKQEVPCVIRSKDILSINEIIYPDDTKIGGVSYKLQSYTKTTGKIYKVLPSVKVYGSSLTYDSNGNERRVMDRKLGSSITTISTENANCEVTTESTPAIYEPELNNNQRTTQKVIDETFSITATLHENNNRIWSISSITGKFLRYTFGGNGYPDFDGYYDVNLLESSFDKGIIKLSSDKITTYNLVEAIDVEENDVLIRKSDPYNVRAYYVSSVDFGLSGELSTYNGEKEFEVSFGGELKELETNELMQAESKYYYNAEFSYDYLLNADSARYINGIYCIEMECFPDELNEIIDSNGATKNKFGIFDRYSVVIPYRTLNNVEAPFFTDSDGNPIKFIVIGHKFSFEGIVRQTLLLQELKA